MKTNTQSLLMKSLDLPYFSTLEQLSNITGLSTRLLYCLSNLSEKYYKTKTILKRNGEKRYISIPSYTLNIVQNWILVNILNKLVPSNQSMAFRKGSLYGSKQNAVHHAHTLYGLSIDLKDFFPSISAQQVYVIFSSLGYNRFASTILTNLCTLEGKLPQGSSCSPALSNLVCATLDRRLSGLCEKRNIIFTRYADDMYFSCDDKSLLLRNFPLFKSIIEDEGFVINDNKTHFHTPSHRKRITGITVIQNLVSDKYELKAPKKMKRKIRAEIFKCIMTGDYSTKQHILGEISYVTHIEKENDFNYISSLKQYITKTSYKIIFFPELIDEYNKNLFFKDMSKIDFGFININDEDDIDYFSSLFSERKAYLSKNNLEDICQYSNWPDIILFDYNKSDDENSFPF